MGLQVDQDGFDVAESAVPNTSEHEHECHQMEGGAAAVEECLCGRTLCQEEAEAVNAQEVGDSMVDVTLQGSSTPQLWCQHLNESHGWKQLQHKC